MNHHLDDVVHAAESDGHLTVAAVAARLGVAASTLRTWDRRYGLGPSQRQAGSHRRYSPDDFARLETMRALTQRGVALADAARMAIQSAPRSAVMGEDLDSLTLAAAAVDSGHERLVRALLGSASKIGLLETLTERLVPALELLAGSPRSDVPGHDPEAALTAALLAVVRERTTSPLPTGRGDLVLVVASPAPGGTVTAHVLAGAFHEAGLRARVVKDDVDEARTHHRCRDGVALVVELHSDRAVVEAARHGVDHHGLLLVGPGAPEVPGAHRVRTLAAAIPEARDMVRERVGAAPEA